MTEAARQARGKSVGLKGWRAVRNAVSASQVRGRGKGLMGRPAACWLGAVCAAALFSVSD